MNKMFTLCLTLLSVLSVSAQDFDKTFEFCDKNGNVIADGSTVTYSDAEVDPDFGSATVHADLFIKNVTDKDAYAAIECVATDMPNGAFKICFPSACIQRYDSSFTITTDGGGKTDGSAITKEDGPVSLETAWLPDNYGSFDVTYQIFLCESKKVPSPFGEGEIDKISPVATGNKITVKYVYADPAGINGVNDKTAKKETARYNIGGQQVKANSKGVSIVKYSDGTTVKVVK